MAPSYKYQSSLNHQVRRRNHILHTIRLSSPLMAEDIPATHLPRPEVSEFNEEVYDTSKRKLLSAASDLERAAIIIRSISFTADDLPFIRVANRDEAVGWLSTHDQSGEICALALQCHKARDYTPLLKHGSLLTREHGTKTPEQQRKPLPQNTPRKPDHEIEKEVRIKLEAVRPHLVSAVRGERRLSTWTAPPGSEYSDHINALRIPILNHAPSLLLHRLGQWEGVDDIMKELFKLQHAPCMLYDTPGSGKTRTLLEGLCRYFGLYLPCSNKDSLGSADLPEALRSIQESSRFTSNFAMAHGEDASRLVEANEDVAEHRIYQVMVARLQVFRCFLEVVFTTEPALSTDDAKRLWALLQIAPMELLEGKDIFGSISEIYLSAEIVYLRRLAKTVSVDIERQLPPDQGGIFIIIDEAQIAAKQRGLRSHAESSKLTERPVLRQVVSTLHKTPLRHTLIVSGTALSKLDIEEALSSFGLDNNPIATLSQSGSFSLMSTQSDYIRSYLPETYLSSPPGQHLLVRAHRWLSGRYRFTATYLQLLLRAHLQRPHQLLSSFVEFATEYKPVDCHPAYLEPGGTPIQTSQFVREFDFTRLDQLSDDHPCIRHIYTCLGYRVEGVEFVEAAPAGLVESAFARVLSGGIARITEPLPLLALQRWIQGKGYEQLAIHLGSRVAVKDSRSVTLEVVVALHLLTVMNMTTPLKTLFNFVEPVPEWASSGAVILAWHAGTSPSEESYSSAAQHPWTGESTSNPTFALRPMGSGAHQESLDWLQNPKGIPFLLPSGCGPDLMALARLHNGDVIWLAVQVKNHASDLSPERLKSAISSITPKKFFPTSERARQTANAMLEEHATHPVRVLRIIASYPSAVNIDAYDSHLIPDIQQHPLAVLEGEALRANDPSRFLHLIVPSVGGQKRSRDFAEGAGRRDTQLGHGRVDHHDDDSGGEGRASSDSDYVETPRSRQRMG
ncbi:hypothetical protein EIP91_012337 [Steccherinum ochraceum]|uniref:Uncharacterized protein n=1 Tax=Steccherinum ochraceum TaxID=92696 RepID=A0A4R0RJ31_9APHY|nr:hypothetical protein EIP91_012337 [Steccherinum ochraceum]